MNLLQKCLNKFNKKIKKGRVIVISAPSGTGKTTICKKLLKLRPDLVFSVSYTTREKRKTEVDGKDYHFISVKKFMQMVKQGKFIEWAYVHNNYYATPKQPLIKAINSGKDILLDIDVQGGKNVKKLFPDGIFIFLLPPSWKDLKKRIINRGLDSQREIETRLKNVNKELKYIKYYDYIVVNDDLNTTVEIIDKIITATKYKMKLSC